MASTYKHLRCPGCDGTLEYSKEKKVWICKYCGNEIRREEEYDGLYTIKNVVGQVLSDLAYERLDSALKNLVECQKISSDYAGTVIANICYKVFTLITPGACQQSEVKGLFGQVKRLYGQLEAAGQGISAEEEALYESFDGNQDAFGVLLLVFDTVGAQAHVDFVRQFFEASMVYSSSLNSHLLNYAFRNHELELINQILSNADNINCREALFILLSSYQDCEEKRKFMGLLFERAQFLTEDFKRMDQYLTETKDCTETKVTLYCHSVRYRMNPSMNHVLGYIMQDDGITKEQIIRVLQAFAQTHPKDSELYELIDQIFREHPGALANMELEVLTDSSLFIKPSDKSLKLMTGRGDWTADERVQVLSRIPQFKLDDRERDAILAEILLRNTETTDNRLVLLSGIVRHVDTVSTNVFTDYVLNHSIDGDRKAEVVELLLGLNLNMSFFRELLSKYMRSDTDSPKVKKRISEMLGDKGLQVDSEALLNMACEATSDNYMEAAAFLQKAIQNGTRIDPMALSCYLERVRPEDYHGEFLSLLYTPNSRISDQALADYVLYYHDSYDIKMQNSQVFAEKNGKAFGTSVCEIRHLDSSIRCNLFQAYVLLTDDSEEAAKSMTAVMKNAGAKLNPNIMVNAQNMKFKKYAADRKAQLSPVTEKLCEENRVFSLFF